MEPWIRLNRADLEAQRPVGAQEDVHFTEPLVERVIEEFSKVGDLVLDPFAGFGTTAVVAVRMGRRAIAVEILPERVELIRRRVQGLAHVVLGDARQLRELVDETVDLCLTSPPYMTRTGHLENPLTGYRSLDGAYETYLETLGSVAAQVAALLAPGGHFVVNAATIRQETDETPLADDIAAQFARHLVRRPDLPIAWDRPPPGIVDDRCLVFQKAGG